MKLVSLTLLNFMPYKGEVHIQFPMESDKNVLVIFGDNMRGKTSILNGVRWVLYSKALGRHSREIKITDIINKEAARKNDWRVEAHLKFEANGNSYDLRRIADRKSETTTPTSKDDYRYEVHLRKNGEPIRGDLVEHEINNVCPEAISRFFLFDGELLQEYETLLIDDSQQGKQIKESIEKVLGVPALINARDDIRVILKNARKRQTVDLRQVEGLQAQAERIENIIAEIDSIENDLSILKAKVEEKETEHDKLDDEVRASHGLIEAQTSLAIKTSQREELEKRYESLQDKRKSLISMAWKDLINVKLETMRDSLTKEQDKVMEQIKKQSTLQVEMLNLQSLLKHDRCPTCDSELRSEKRRELMTKLDEYQNSMEDAQSWIDRNNDITRDLSNMSGFRRENILSQLRSVDEDITKIDFEAQKLENEIEKDKQLIEGNDTSEIARKRERLKNLTKMIADLKVRIEDQEETLRAKNEELKVAQKGIEGMTKNRMQRSTTKVSVCESMEKLFDKGIENLRDRLRSKVGDLANEAFSAMSTQKNYQGLEINENYGLNIIDGGGRPVPVRSAGAEQIVALSLIDGLNRTGRAAGPVLMDTPFGRLDLKHRDNVLEYLPKVTSQFILLVHSGEIRPETDLDVISHRIGGFYRIKEVSDSESRLERE